MSTPKAPPRKNTSRKGSNIPVASVAEPLYRMQGQPSRADSIVYWEVWNGILTKDQAEQIADTFLPVLVAQYRTALTVELVVSYSLSARSYRSSIFIKR